MNMATDFSRNLALLRREKRISQRSAAADLGVSQALLSHYENGVREPGLNFVIRCCAYYECSSDFLLGRTMHRGDAEPVDALEMEEDDPKNLRRGNVLATLNREIVFGSLSIVFDLAARSGSRSLIREVSHYLTTSIYKVFRLLYKGAEKTPGEFFPVPDHAFSQSCDAEIKLCEMRMDALVTGKKLPCLEGEQRAKIPEISDVALRRDYPQNNKALFSLLHNANERLKRQLERE